MGEERQPLVEEEQQSRAEHGETDPLRADEPLVKDEHAADEQEKRRDLDHDLGHRRRHVVEREEVEDEIPDQRERRDGEQRDRGAALAGKPGKRAAQREKCAEARHRGGEAPPDDRVRIHALEDDLERDGQEAPQRGGREGKRETEPPVGGAVRHVHS